MNSTWPNALAQLGGTGAGGTAWTLTFEGAPLGWVLPGFLILAAGTVYAYLKLTPVSPAWRRFALIGLRMALFAVFVLLVIKPVLHLTLNEPVRQTLLVAIDASQSMAVKDKRERPEDLTRAAIGTGALSPDRGLEQKAPGDATSSLSAISRWDLLRQLAANEKLDLWPNLSEQADLAFYGVGRQAVPAGVETAPGTKMSRLEAGVLFDTLQPEQPSTALGDALGQLLREERSRPVAGVFLVTDGQSNVGASPAEAAQFAREQGVPLYIYGLGVTSPPDIILEEISTQKLAFVKERVEVRARVRAQGLENRTVTARLRVNGVDVAEQSLEISGDGERQLTLQFEPEDVGDARLEVELEPLAEEASHENNRASARLRVTDEKFNVLLLEQEPRWDFRYLLAYLQRDRRLEVTAAVIDGEPGLDRDEGSVFLPALPSDREEFFRAEVIILGDVNPTDLGEERMEILRDWVEAGGGIIFLAGPKHSPLAYADTPLERLLPVTPDPAASPRTFGQRLRQPFKLALTPAGESSPYLQMAAEPEENRAVWENFVGVRWTAGVLRAKPGAEVLLVDPRPEVANRYGAQPVFAMQHYGAGTCVYLGTDETYRWRSGVGEQYYSVLWGQIMQSLALELLEGGSARTQLKADRRQYVAGDKVVLTGRAYDEGFTPYIAPALEGTLRITTEGPNGEAVEREEPLNLGATAEGGFRAEFESVTPGDYEFFTTRDPETILRFEVVEPRLEKIQTSLNERLLRSMAEATGGRFLREENLHELPSLIQEKRATVSTFQKKELFHSNWWLLALISLAVAEWFIRRVSQLK